MNVLFVASECIPFVKTGGLADVIGSLPQEVKSQQQDADIRVMLPYYDEIASEWQEKMEEVACFHVPVGWRNQHTVIFQLVHREIVYYFVANDYYFSRKGIYGYYDDGERFVYFAHAVVDALAHLDFAPEIIHAHDWQAGLVPALSKIILPEKNIRTVFTIHNIKYQGLIPPDMFDDFFQLSREHFGGLEWRGMINCMKSGIFHADKITTVSPSYAKEIIDPHFGEGLDPILRERENDVTGIINGVDLSEFNPQTDPFVPVPFTYSKLKKKENKLLLQERLRLPEAPDIPMYILVSRLVEQKGLPLLQHIIGEFVQENIQLVILGTGDPEFEWCFQEWARRFPEKVSAQMTFDEALARHMYAGADFLLMPSQFEPCGLSQLIAFQYKTVPIVRETGGLKDTVQPYNEMTCEGNGFSFTHYNAHDFLHVLRYSLQIYHDDVHWAQLYKNVTKTQFSWKDSAAVYTALYQSLENKVYS
ncbi:starch synthase [Evansella caseinilytica]|uniref:Glycogen synthase n=1 Tax=Evansella caseinilytica TaxID=1503961 RepID=A0A1H3PF74_9BACI|nr:glycogen synthase GlgA [Evansella caseinilytica]SDY99731.1 starch synthase [Evansella caseinilytica]